MKYGYFFPLAILPVEEPRSFQSILRNRLNMAKWPLVSQAFTLVSVISDWHFQIDRLFPLATWVGCTYRLYTSLSNKALQHASAFGFLFLFLFFVFFLPWSDEKVNGWGMIVGRRRRKRRRISRFRRRTTKIDKSFLRWRTFSSSPSAVVVVVRERRRRWRR